MGYFGRSQVGGLVSALLLLGVAWTAHAQGPATNSSTASPTNNSGNSPGPVLGPPALKDFQIEPRERLVTQPTPPPERPSTTTPPEPAPTAERPAASDRPPVRSAAPTVPSAGTRPDRSVAPETIPSNPAPAVALPPLRDQPESQTVQPPAAPAETAPAPDGRAAPPPPQRAGTSGWLYALPLLGLLALGFALWRRRRTGRPQAVETAAVPAHSQAPRAVRPDPQRAWLELDLKAQRATYTDSEWVVQFELSVSNTGPVPARNLRIDVMLFNAGKEQDKEISAFFRTAGRESTKLNLPGIQAGETGVIDGEVAMPLAEMRAMKLSDRTLFIPVVAVNGLYEWGEGSSGQTAKSYIVGRELQEPSDKMGAFRVDLGPRIWRMVAQRPHKLARRF